ncbi:integrase/recombinase xerD homolog [Pseudophryne corroboree]|uniref:integrase/recombinase xerD homolog n=1 Tax=Pseudophryne corroboree TaxID=495146 RepID=UPI0030820C35
MPFSSLADSRACLNELVERSLAPKTWKAYVAAWEKWQQFQGNVSSEGQAPLQQLLEFLGKSKEEGASRAVANTRLALVSFFSKLLGKEDLTKAFVVRTVMKGWARVEIRRPDSREPVTIERLKSIIHIVAKVCNGEYEEKLFKAAFIMAFSGAFRVGELVAQSKMAAGTGLLVKNIAASQGAVLCKIHKSKTDQIGKGRWVQLGRHPDTTVCPIEVVQKFLEVRPKGGENFLIHVDQAALTRFQFTAIFKKCIKVLGWNPRKFGTHSSRIGAATSAASQGCSAEEIKGKGGWKSNSYKSYVRLVARAPPQ